MSFSTLKIAWRNLWRNRTRTLIALGAITLAQTFVVSMGGLMEGMFQDMFDTLTGPFVGHVRVKTRNWRREYDRAEQEYRDAKDAATVDETRVARAQAVMVEARGNSMLFDEFLDDAASEYQQAVELYRKTEDRSGLGRSLAKLGRVAVRRGDDDEARRQFARAKDEFDAAGDAAASAAVTSFMADPSPVAKEVPERILDVTDLKVQLQSLDGVTTVSPRILTAVLAFKAVESDVPADAHAALIAGLDLELETQTGGLLDDFGARPLPPPGSVIVGKGLAKRLGVAEGDQIAVLGQRVDESPVDALFKVAAVMRSDVEMINGGGIAMSYSDAANLLAAENSAHEIIIRSTDHEKAGELADTVRALPGLVDAEVLPWYEANPEIAQMLQMKDGMDFIFVVILFIAAAAGIANTMMMSTFERKREFGMLLGVGCRPFRIVSMVMVESVVLGVMGVLIGSAIGIALVTITSHTGINYAVMTGVGDKGTDMAFAGLNFSFIMYPKLDLSFVTSGMIAVTLTSLVASLLPALSASFLEPMEALRS